MARLGLGEQVGQRGDVLGRIDHARRVVGRVDHDGAGARSDGGVDSVQIQAELGVGGHDDRHALVVLDVIDVLAEEGRQYDHLVAELRMVRRVTLAAPAAPQVIRMSPTPKDRPVSAERVSATA